MSLSEPSGRKARLLWLGGRGRGGLAQVLQASDTSLGQWGCALLGMAWGEGGGGDDAGSAWGQQEHPCSEEGSATLGQVSGGWRSWVATGRLCAISPVRAQGRA